MAKAKSNGERGQPCLVPRDNVKYLERELFVWTLA